MINSQLSLSRFFDKYFCSKLDFKKLYLFAPTVLKTTNDFFNYLLQLRWMLKVKNIKFKQIILSMLINVSVTVNFSTV